MSPFSIKDHKALAQKFESSMYWLSITISFSYFSTIHLLVVLLNVQDNLRDIIIMIDLLYIS